MLAWQAIFYHLLKAVKNENLKWVKLSCTFSYGNTCRQEQTMVIISLSESILSDQLQKFLIQINNLIKNHNEHRKTVSLFQSTNCVCPSLNIPKFSMQMKAKRSFLSILKSQSQS